MFLSQPIAETLTLILFLFLPLHLIDPPPASDDTPILSVVSPPTAADREQFYSSELYSTTGTAWSSAATGETNTSPAGT